MSKHHRTNDHFADESPRGGAHTSRGGRRKPKPRVCRASSKSRFPDREAAKDALFSARQTKKANPNAHVPIRYYSCGECRGYHLTSKPEQYWAIGAEQAEMSGDFGTSGEFGTSGDFGTSMEFEALALPAHRASTRPDSRPHMRMRANGKNTGSSAPIAVRSLSEYLSTKRS